MIYLRTFIILLFSSSLWAWGSEGHQRINRRAPEALPPPLREYFSSHVELLARLSTEPDSWKGADPEERGRHFIDLEEFGQAPSFSRARCSYPKAVSRFGKEKLAAYGSLPWRIEEYQRFLVESFRKGDWPQALRDAAHLGHYVADAFEPLHCTLNYDGQLTGNRGIHMRFEDEMLKRFRNKFVIKPIAARRMRDPLAEAFRVVVEGNGLAPKILASDSAARAHGTGSSKYYSELYRLSGDLAAARLSQASSFLASLWFSAWKEAGSPAVPARLR